MVYILDKTKLFLAMSLSVSGIEFEGNSSFFIRGYNTTLDFKFNVTNHESILRIDPALPGTTNFDLGAMAARPSSRRRRDVSIESSSQLRQELVVSDVQLSQRVLAGETVTITGQV